MDCGEEGLAQFVIARRDASEMFQLVEKALDAIAPSVAVLVVVGLLAARAHRRNDCFNTVERQAFADAIGIVTFVEGRRLQDVVGIKTVIKNFKLPTIVRFPWGQVERNATVFVDRRRVDFRRETSARSSQSLIAPVFFGAPAAC